MSDFLVCIVGEDVFTGGKTHNRIEEMGTGTWDSVHFSDAQATFPGDWVGKSDCGRQIHSVPRKEREHRRLPENCTALHRTTFAHQMPFKLIHSALLSRSLALRISLVSSHVFIGSSLLSFCSGLPDFFAVCFLSLRRSPGLKLQVVLVVVAVDDRPLPCRSLM
jgi:hypothetical protein